MLHTCVAFPATEQTRESHGGTLSSKLAGEPPGPSVLALSSAHPTPLVPGWWTGELWLF